MKTVDRALSSDEHALLVALVAGESVPAEVRGQVDHVRVTGRCDCGCGTINLGVDRTKSNSGLDPRVWFAEADIVGSQSDLVMLFVKEGWIKTLEVLWYEDPRPLPRAEEVTAARVRAPTSPG